MKNTQRWLQLLIENNIICSKYRSRVENAETKEDIFRIVCDPNGVSFFAELLDKKIAVPFEIFSKEFASFINGKKVMTYPQGFTSKMYIGTKETITADTTLVAIYGCDSEVSVPTNKYPKIVLGNKSNVSITVGLGARLLLDVYNGSTYTISGDQTHVTINKKNKNTQNER